MLPVMTFASLSCQAASKLPAHTGAVRLRSYSKNKQIVVAVLIRITAKMDTFISQAVCNKIIK
jgi:hypothetical protein